MVFINFLHRASSIQPTQHCQNEIMKIGHSLKTMIFIIRSF